MPDGVLQDRPANREERMTTDDTDTRTQADRVILAIQQRKGGCLALTYKSMWHDTYCHRKASDTGLCAQHAAQARRHRRPFPAQSPTAPLKGETT